jgi:hypothetical protein
MDKHWWEHGVFLAVGTIAALILGILPVVMPPGRALAIADWSIAGAVLLVIAILWHRSRKLEQLPPKSVALDISIAMATPDDLLWIANLEKSYFHDDAIPLAILTDWYAKNPNGFQIVCDERGNRVGHLNVLPVKEEAFSPFIAGKIYEREITGNALFPPAERDLVRDLYVESVIVKHDDKKTHQMAVTLLLNRVDTILSSLGNPANLRHVYGLAATDAGRNFMHGHGFDVVGEAHDRVDEHPLYRIRYSDLRKRLHGG